MYNGIGLRTVRGSATSGYVQTNRAYVRPSSVRMVVDGNTGANQDWSSGGPRRIKANDGLLEHQRKREIEAKIFELTETMTEQGYSETEIVKKVAETRQQLRGREQKLSSKDNSTHAVAQRKGQEMKRLAAAFGVREDHQEGEAFDPEMQEQRRQERAAAHEARHREWEG